MTRSRDNATNVAGDISGVTAGTGLSGGGTGGTVTLSVDTALVATTSNTMTLTNKTISASSNTLSGVINNTLTTTTGDMIYASGANTPARLGIGSSGQVLTVASGIPSWATASSGGGITLLSTTNIGSVTSVTVSINATGYESVRIAIRDFSLSSSGNPLFVRFNSDSNNNYFRTNTKSGFGQSDEAAGGGGSASKVGTTSQVRNNQTDSVWILDILNPNDTTVFKVGHFTSYLQRINDSGDGCESGGFTYKSTSAITSVTFGIETSGTFSAGDIKVYGIN